MNWDKLREQALKDTKKKVADSVNDDNLIIQSISAVEELTKTSNLLLRRLREWYELINPEHSKNTPSDEKFLRTIKNDSKSVMGAQLGKKDTEKIYELAHTIDMINQDQAQFDRYVEEVMARHCPNILAITGATIGARILREAGSLEKLAKIQASTIQMYGAEKALFRHLRTGAKPPKYGYLIHHPLVMKGKGKAARALADKIGIAAKVDYFKGEPIGEKLREQLEKRFS